MGAESDKVVELGAAADRLGGQSLHSVLIAQQPPPSLSVRCGVYFQQENANSRSYSTPLDFFIYIFSKQLHDDHEERITNCKLLFIIVGKTS